MAVSGAERKEPYDVVSYYVNEVTVHAPMLGS